MTRREFETAKRAACVRYITNAETDAMNAKGLRARNNATKRIESAKRVLRELDGGTFWTPFRETAFRNLYENLPAGEPVSAV